MSLISSDSIEGCSLRLCNVFGHLLSSQKNDRGILDKVYNRCLEGQPIEILGSGNFYRDYVHVNDVVDAIHHTILNRRVLNGTINYIGSGNAISLKEAFSIVRSIAMLKVSRKSKFKYTGVPSDINKIHLRNFKADIQDFSSLTGWFPKIGLEKLNE